MGKRTRKNKVRNAALDTILVCLIFIFCFSAYKLYVMMKAYKADQTVYERVREEVGAPYNIDWDELKKTNPEVVAWIYLEDTVINYPIVKGPDNNKYLHTLFDGSSGGAGTLFADAATEDPFRQFNTIVYGHHMRDGSMFNCLKKFKSVDFAKEHSRFELLTPEQNYHLDMLAFLNEPASSKVYAPNVPDGSQQEYLDILYGSADYILSDDAGEDDSIVLLSTCAYEYDNARYIVAGKLIPDDQPH